jgi:hypothetical protein
MRKYIQVVLFVGLFFFLSAVFSQVHAEDRMCADIIRSTFSVSGFPVVTYDGHPYASYTPQDINFSGLTPNTEYELSCLARTAWGDLTGDPEMAKVTGTSDSSGNLTWRMESDTCYHKSFDKAHVFEASGVDAYIRVRVNGQNCDALRYRIENEAKGVSCAWTTITENQNQTAGCFQPGDVVNFSVRLTGPTGLPYRNEVMYHMDNIFGGGVASVRTPDAEGMIYGSGAVIQAGEPVEARVRTQLNGFLGVPEVWELGPDRCAYISPTPVQATCTEEDRLQTPLPTGSATTARPFNLCKQIPLITEEQISGIRIESASRGDASYVTYSLEQSLRDRQERLRTEKQQCCQCAGGTFNGEDCVFSGETNVEGQGIYTAVGCIPSTADGIVRSLVRVGLGIAGGVALLMILAGSFMLSTSQGEPKRAGEAKEMITSAVMGLIFIVFSVAILQFIGISLLRIPGFGAAP